MMDERWGVPWRGGTLRPLAQATTQAVAAPGEAAWPYGPAHAAAHREETRWRQGGKAGVVMGSGDEWGDRGCGAEVTRWRRRPRWGRGGIASARAPAAGRAAGVPCARGDGPCRALRKRREAWWPCVQLDGGEPTHHAAAVRSVDQQPSFQRGGLVPRCKGGHAAPPENAFWVSMPCRPPLVRG
jgi:hypothetical protein